jgi:hypothetical protein
VDRYELPTLFALVSLLLRCRLLRLHRLRKSFLIINFASKLDQISFEKVCQDRLAELLRLLAKTGILGGDSIGRLRYL